MIYDMAGRALQPLKVAYRVFVCTHACVAIQLLALAVALCTLNSIAALCCATLCAHRHKVMSFVVLCNMLRAPLACTCVQILGLFKNKGWRPQHRFLNMIYIYIYLSSVLFRLQVFTWKPGCQGTFAICSSRVCKHALFVAWWLYTASRQLQPYVFHIDISPPSGNKTETSWF